MKYTIKSEDDAFSILESLKSLDSFDDVQFVFDGWPRYEIIIRGEDFHGGIPTRIMPKIINVQKELRHVYSLHKYGDEKAKLSRAEKQATELIIYLDSEHSTGFAAELSELFNFMAKELIGQMSGEEALLAILGIAAIAGVTYLGQLYIKKRFELKETKQENERLQIVANLVNTNGTLLRAQEIIEGSQQKLLTSLENEDLLVLNNGEVLDAITIKKSFRKSPEKAVHDRMDGQFDILSVDSGSVENGFKLKVRNIETRQELLVTAPEGTLDDDQIKILQSGEWGKKPLHMKINYKKLRERISDAKLIEAGLSEVE